jgi:hypothetical protein
MAAGAAAQQAAWLIRPAKAKASVNPGQTCRPGIDAGRICVPRFARKGRVKPGLPRNASPGLVLLPVCPRCPASPRSMPSGRSWGVAMRGPFRRAVVAVGAAVVLLGPAAGAAAQANVTAAAAASASRPGWSITPSPNPRAANGALNAVSCPTTSVCMAVGLHVRQSGLGVTLAERRSGGRWAVQSTPNPHGAAASALNGVSCPSGSACTAVGQFAVGSGAQLTLAERWNGGSWRIQRTPNPPGSPSSRLSAVACPAADTCTAVGTSGSTLLVERWDGSRWRIQSAPAPSGAQFSELNGVTCTATASCVAVGDYVNSSGLDVTLAERWNGTSWAIQPTPNPSGGQFFRFLGGVSCTAPVACEAVGASDDAGAFAERWNGTSWSLQAVPAPAGAQQAFLFNVSCAVSSCEAVGGYANRSGAFVPLGERWNGTAWRAHPVPNPARASTNFLNGVSCPSASDCTAAGQGNGDGTPFPLGERWRDGRWSLQAVPAPAGAAENQLNGIACPATGRCMAVGTAGPTRGVASAEALRWNGTRWRVQPIPTVPGASLSAVACASPSACMAVGGSDSGVLAERWNGASWRIQPIPTPAGAVSSGLGGISCLSLSFCMAAGAYSTSSSPDGPFQSFTEQWNGKKWAIVPSPNPPGAVQTFLGAVSCTSPLACTTSGEQHSATGIVHTVAERWNGAAWRIQATPTPPKAQFASLPGVDCTGPSACLAVGSSDQGPLAERWNGARWRVQPTPASPGGQLTGLACSAPAACTAVGFTFTSTGGMILAERWNGTTWRIQPTPLLPAAHDISPPAVACPARTACIAVGGFENDGPGSVSLAERWRGSRTPPAPTTPGAFSPPTHSGIAGCIRAALGDGFATGAAAPRIGPRFKAPMPQPSQPASGIERVTSLCSAA